MANGDIRAEIRDNLARVRDSISASARQTGRKPEDITLITVSKGISQEITALAEAEGARIFGESRVQEAQKKIPMMPPGLEWHMIGRLQSNKVREALPLFSLIHSVDRESLAEAIDRHAQESGRPARILVQANITGSEKQGGVPVMEIPAFIDKISALAYLRICGLMAIGPYPAGETELRESYRKVKKAFDGLAGLMGEDFRVLSTGMSGDFATAIEEGSTMVRIGTAIFGDRRYK